MYGKKSCLEYKGISKQCNNCFGPHFKKYCRLDRVSLVTLADNFRLKYPSIPEEFYSELAKNIDNTKYF